MKEIIILGGPNGAGKSSFGFRHHRRQSRAWRAA
jgi:predicted ABC-type ATPase